MEAKVGGLVFTSKFDSGNLARVEKVFPNEDAVDSENGIVFILLSNVVVTFHNVSCRLVTRDRRSHDNRKDTTHKSGHHR